MTVDSSDPSLEIDLPSEVRAGFTARQALDAFADTLGIYDLNTTKLLASELVVNAVKHGAGPILRASVTGQTVHVQVANRDDGSVSRSPEEGLSALNGSGRQLVDGLASRWGAREGTTHVWFELERCVRPMPVRP